MSKQDFRNEFYKKYGRLPNSNELARFILLGANAYDEKERKEE